MADCGGAAMVGMQPLEFELGQKVKVVVLGGSAGSLEPFAAVLSGLTAPAGFAVLVVAHLDPTQQTRLDTLLQHHTTLPVERLVNGRRIEHEHVYVLPEGANVTAMDGHFRLTRRQPGPHLPLDLCLASLAQDPDVDAAAVVLSGAGNDGAAGVVDLKSTGGLVLAQAPQTAAHAGMPTAAIDTGLVDEVLAPAEIAAVLVRRFGRGEAARADADAPAAPADPLAEALEQALAIVQQKTGVNLGYVKDVNLRRRFLRRVLLQKERDVQAYLQKLRHDAREAEALRDDVLIGVTAFFRDAEFVNVLRQTVIPRLLELRQDPLRIWVPACSTGEEVYTIAILVKEALDAAGLGSKVQIFGTDINEAAIEVARAGRYGASALENVPEIFHETAFVGTSGGYLVSKQIRELCVFAHHHLLAQAPFSGIGLVSCRNLLIYLRKEAQQHVFEVLHYACRPDGFLILGRAEAPSAADGFEHAGAPHLYRKTPLNRRQQGLPMDALRQWASDGSAARAARTRDAADPVDEAANRAALARYAPPGFVVDETGEVVLFRGDVADFVAPVAGEATLALPRLLRAELNVPVRTALIEAKHTGEAVRRERVAVGEHRYVLEVLPLGGAGEARHCLVTLQRQPDEAALPAAPSQGATPGRVEELERTVATLSDELEAAQAQLKTLIVEFESANEELRTSNEEMLSANEELQSANEELQSAKQELESANQELNSLNDELAARNGQLALANDDLSNLVEGIPLPVVLLDRQLRLRHCSPQAAALFAFGPDSVGRPLPQANLRFAQGDLQRLVQAAVQGLAAVEREYRDVEGRWWLINVRAYRTADDRIDGAVIAFQDIDALRRAIDEAQHARSDAERANAAKDDFLALVSHELRAPLNVIAGWAAVLDKAGQQAPGAVAAVPKAVQTIQRYCQVQAQLIDDLLDVSRISSGRLALDMRPVDLPACVRSVVDGLQPTAKAKELSLAGVGLQRPLTVQGDARRLQQVAQNLLGNALKFTPRGGRVDVTVARIGALVELSVVDTGIGVPADQLPFLFERFAPQNMSRTREYGGLGLGLSIVKHLVQAHGGTVAVHSDGEGHGTRFTVRLPAVDVPAREPQALTRPVELKLQLEGLSVLLVDDDADGREALHHMLMLAGARVDVAASARDALERLRDQRFDALVSDIAMPGTDGYELVRAARGRERSEGLKRSFAIALTGFASIDDREAAIRAGFDDHVPKPVDPQRLIETLMLARGR
jgi:two-component system, chemotaxis family, CheB/CheR fusion protein